MAKVVEFQVSMAPGYTRAAKLWIRLMWAAQYLVGIETAYHWARSGCVWIVQRGIRIG